MSIERIATRCICCNEKELIKTPAVLMPFIAKRIFDHEPVEIKKEWGLRDLQAGRAYSVCNSLFCISCEAIFLDYRFSEDEMNLLYRDYRGEVYTSLREFYEPGYRKTNLHFEHRADYLKLVDEFILNRVPMPSHILDWGGGTGINSPLRGFGINIHVYDISNISPLDGVISLSKDELDDSQYSLVTCSQVFEHLSWPAHVLSEIVEHIAPGGYLYLEVPFEPLMKYSVLASDIYSNKHHWHEHINFFSKKSIEVMVSLQNLLIIDTLEVATDEQGRERSYIGILCKRPK